MDYGPAMRSQVVHTHVPLFTKQYNLPLAQAVS